MGVSLMWCVTVFECGNGRLNYITNFTLEQDDNYFAKGSGNGIILVENKKILFYGILGVKCQHWLT